MEVKEKPKKEDMGNREKVLVPVRRQRAADEEEDLEPTEKIWKMPRRWHVY